MFSSKGLLARAVPAAFALALMAGAMMAQAIVVTPSNPQGWAAQNVQNAGTVAITNDHPRSGDGSLCFSSQGSNDKADYEIQFGQNSFLLKDLSALSFEWYRDAGGTAAAHFAPALRLMFVDNANPLAPRAGLLIWENVYNTPDNATDVWHAENLIDENFWMRAYGPSRTIEDFDVTIDDWLTAGEIYGSGSKTVPNLNADTTYIVGFSVGVGSGWAGTFNGCVDNISFTAGDRSATYNFEPDTVVPEPATLTLVGLGLAGIARVARRRRA